MLISATNRPTLRSLAKRPSASVPSAKSASHNQVPPAWMRLVPASEDRHRQPKHRQGIEALSNGGFFNYSKAAFPNQFPTSVEGIRQNDSMFMPHVRRSSR